MKKIVLLIALSASIFASSSDGIILGFGIGSTSTTTTASTSGYVTLYVSEKESGGTSEISLEYRLKSNYQFGLTYGNIAVGDTSSSVNYVIATADYIFMKDSKWRPFIGIALGNSQMDYKISGLSLSDSSVALGIRAGVAYELDNWAFGYKFQYLKTDLEESDILLSGTSRETKFVVKHENFMNNQIFVKYHF